MNSYELWKAWVFVKLTEVGITISILIIFVGIAFFMTRNKK